MVPDRLACTSNCDLLGLILCRKAPFLGMRIIAFARKPLNMDKAIVIAYRTNSSEQGEKKH